MLKYFMYLSLFITLNYSGFYVDCGRSSNSQISTAIQIDVGEQDVNQEASFVKEFRDINDRLIGKTHSCDAELNMKFVERIYHEDIDQKVDQQYRYVKAKKLILDLKTLLDKSTCNAKGHNIAVQNFLALDGRVLKKDKRLDYCLSRLDNIFAHYLERHAELCRQVYYDSLKDRLEKMDKNKVKSVDYFTGNAIFQLISKKKDENKSKNACQRLVLLTSVHFNPGPKYILQRLRTLAKGHRDEKALTSFKDIKTSMMMIDGVKFGRLFREFLVEPCRYYEQRLGPDVFKPVSFEREFHKVDENNPDFYKAWGRYRLCVHFNRQADEKLQETINYAMLNSNE